jgi:hypothetical protein
MVPNLWCFVMSRKDILGLEMDSSEILQLLAKKYLLQQGAHNKL